MNNQPIGNDIVATTLQPFLNDPEITEIMADGHDRVYVERNGRLEDVPSPFRDEAHLMAVIQALAGMYGRSIDESTPILDMRLPDSSRVNIIIPPVSLSGALLTLRKFRATPFSFDDLVRFGCLSEAMVTFLRACVQGRLNIAVSGGPSSGKTTLLSLIASAISAEERIVTVQETEGLFLTQPRVVKLESRPPDIHGRGAISVGDLLNNALRMRPDRVILAEAQGGEVLDLVNAILNGHDGCLWTLHASSPQDTLFRLENMAAEGDPSIPLVSLRSKIAAAVDLIVRIERMTDGSRKVLNITHVTGFHDGVITFQDIFEYRKGESVREIRGEPSEPHRHIPTGYIPSFVSVLQAYGLDLPISLFTPR